MPSTYEIRLNENRSPQRRANGSAASASGTRRDRARRTRRRGCASVTRTTADPKSSPRRSNDGRRVVDQRHDLGAVDRPHPSRPGGSAWPASSNRVSAVSSSSSPSTEDRQGLAAGAPRRRPARGGGPRRRRRPMTAGSPARPAGRAGASTRARSTGGASRPAARLASNQWRVSWRRPRNHHGRISDADEPQRAGRVVLDGVVERGTEVVVLVVEALEPGELVGGRGASRSTRSASSMHHAQVVGAAPRPARRARRAARGRRHAATPASSKRTARPDVSATSSERSTRRLASSKASGPHTRSAASMRGPTGEHGEAPERAPLVVEEQLVAPVDGRLQALVARRCRRAGSAAAAAKRSRSRSAISGHRQRLRPGRGQLDGERQAVEVAAQLDELGVAVVVGVNIRLHGAGPLDEQLPPTRRRRAGRRRTGARPRCRAARGWSSRRAVRGTRPAARATHVAAAAATCSQLSRTTTASRSPRRSTARCSGVGGGWPSDRRSLRRADPGGDRLGDRAGLRDRSELDEPHLAAVGEPADQLRGRVGSCRRRRGRRPSSTVVAVDGVASAASSSCAADEGRERRRHAPGGGGDRRQRDRGGERRVVGEHGSLERLQLGTGIEAELVEQVLAGVAVAPAGRRPDGRIGRGR